MRARVYRNLNKGGLSVKTRIDGKWKVTDYTPQIILENCTFRVGEKSRARIAAGANKDVHAWIEGDIVSTAAADYNASAAPIPYYNPRTTKLFEIDGQTVTSAAVIKVSAPPKN